MKRKVTAEWLEFSKLFASSRFIKNKLYLPIDIRRLILSYIRQKRNFFIQDLGSTHGTFIQISHFSILKQTVHKGQNFLIGADIYLNILELQTTKPNSHIAKTKDAML